VEDVGDALHLVVLETPHHRLLVREVQSHTDNLVALSWWDPSAVDAMPCSVVV
jgi:hypothetical protein